MDDSGHDIAADPILSHGQLSSEDVEVLGGLVYSSKAAREACYVWLATDISIQQTNVSITPLIHATLDAVMILGESYSTEGDRVTETWEAHFERLVTNLMHPSTWFKPSDSARDVDSIVFMISHFTKSREKLIRSLTNAVEGQSLDTMSAEVGLVARRFLALEGVPTEETRDIVVACVDHGLQWASRHFASDEALNVSVVQGLSECQVSVVRFSN